MNPHIIQPGTPEAVLAELRDELEIAALRMKLDRRRRHVQRRAMLPMNAARLGSRGKATGRRFE